MISRHALFNMASRSCWSGQSAHLRQFDHAWLHRVPGQNPIEQFFSKLNALLGNAAERTIPGLRRRIGKLLAPFSAKNAKITSSTPAMPQSLIPS